MDLTTVLAILMQVATFVGQEGPLIGELIGVLQTGDQAAADALLLSLETRNAALGAAP